MKLIIFLKGVFFNMLALFFGLITLAIAIAITVGINSYFSFDLMSFSIFFILPLGSIVVGTIASFGYHFGSYLSNKKIDSWRLLLGLVIPIIAFIGVRYGYYATAYLDDDMNLNYKMIGEHVSNYSIEDSEEPLNFVSFTKLMVESSTISFTYRRRNMVNIEGKPVVNWIFFLIDLIGSVVGSLMAMGLVIRGRNYCENCERYMKKQKELFSFPIGDVDTFIKMQDIKTLSSERIKSFLSCKASNNEEHYDVFINWCDKCFEGYINMKCFQRDSRGRLVENDKNNKDIKVSSDIVKTFLGV